MALTANRNVDHFIDQELRTLRVKGSTHIYKGAIVGVTAAGFARGLAAGDAFGGLAYEEIDNTGADGAKSARVYTIGDFEMTVTGVAQTDVGRPVFASADDTLSLTGDGNAYVGVIRDYVASNTAIVRIDPFRKLVKTVVHVVENLSAGADIAARAIFAFCQDGWIVCAHVINQATAAAGIDAGNTCVVALANTAGAVASKTFNNTVTFPAANAASSMGTITNPHCPPGDVLTLAVTNGATADPGQFVVEVCYV